MFVTVNMIDQSALSRYEGKKKKEGTTKTLFSVENNRELMEESHALISFFSKPNNWPGLGGSKLAVAEVFIIISLETKLNYIELFLPSVTWFHYKQTP